MCELNPNGRNWLRRGARAYTLSFSLCVVVSAMAAGPPAPPPLPAGYYESGTVPPPPVGGSPPVPIAPARGVIPPPSMPSKVGTAATPDPSN
jgi:hypothetical protein